MQLHLARPAAFAAVALLIGAGVLAPPANAQGAVAVQLDGRILPLSPPPTIRAGRVFVPLRGVFERMGATVVYADGTVECQGHGRSVQVRIGSQNAIVDGHPVLVDVAPFIIGASTYVPLRFVSQALGANVAWNDTDRIAAIAYAAPQAYVAAARVEEPAEAAPPPEAPPPATVALADVAPARDARIDGWRPLIAAAFAGGLVDPRSVRITVDGRDVTPYARISPREFAYTPGTPLPPGPHAVRVVGVQRDGAPFMRGWTFVVAPSPYGRY